MDNNTLYLILGLLVVIAIIYFLSRKREDSNPTPHITDENMHDALGNKHVNADTASSTNALREEQDHDSVLTREGQAAKKVQHENDEQLNRDHLTTDDHHPAVEPVHESAVDLDVDDHGSTVLDSDFPSVAYDELLSQNGLSGQSVRLEGQLASFFTEDLGVEGAQALGSLSMGTEGTSQLVALKFVQPILTEFKKGDKVAVFGRMQGLKENNNQSIPAIVVDRIEKIM